MKAFHFLNWNLQAMSSVEEEREQKQSRLGCKAEVKRKTTYPQVKPDPTGTGKKPDKEANDLDKRSYQTTDHITGAVSKDMPQLPPDVRDFPRTFKERQQNAKPDTSEGSTQPETVKKRKPDPVGQNSKRKKTGESGKLSNSTIDSFLGANATNGRGQRQRPSNSISQENTESIFALPAGTRVHRGLDDTTATKLNTHVAFNFPKHKKPLVDCLVGGAVKFAGAQFVDSQDLESLYGGKIKDEGNYLTNFVIEAYLKLIATSSASKGVKVETFGWEEFEKWEGREDGHAKLLQNKTPLMDQDFVFVPVNPNKSKHWVLLVVAPKKRKILVLDSLAASYTKPSAVNAVAKMLCLLGQCNKKARSVAWNISTNTPEDIPQQQNSFDCGVYVCMFARSLLLASPVPNSNSISNARHLMILELHHQELQDYSQAFIKEQSYYAVEYDKTFYFGRALESLHSHTGDVEFKFLHSRVADGEKLYDWPRRDDREVVHSSRVFYGPVTVVGVSPFMLPQSIEVELVYQWWRKNRKVLKL